MIASEDLDKIWEKGLRQEKVPAIPDVKYAVYFDKTYYVMEDYRSVYFLMSVDPMSKKDKYKYKAYAVIADKCDMIEGDFYNYYNIKEGGVKVVGCNKDFNATQEYLSSSIQKYLIKPSKEN